MVFLQSGRECPQWNYLSQRLVVYLKSICNSVEQGFILIEKETKHTECNIVLEKTQNII